MTQSAGFLMVHARESIESQKDASQHTSRLLKQNPEDVRLAQRIESALHRTGYGALRVIEISVNSRIVHLMGRVPSYYLKQVAQEIALAIPGAQQIHNGLDVSMPH